MYTFGESIYHGIQANEKRNSPPVKGFHKRTTGRTKAGAHHEALFANEFSGNC